MTETETQSSSLSLSPAVSNPCEISSTRHRLLSIHNDSTTFLKQTIDFFRKSEAPDDAAAARCADEGNAMDQDAGDHNHATAVSCVDSSASSDMTLFTILMCHLPDYLSVWLLISAMLIQGLRSFQRTRTAKGGYPFLQKLASGTHRKMTRWRPIRGQWPSAAAGTLMSTHLIEDLSSFWLSRIKDVTWKWLDFVEVMFSKTFVLSMSLYCRPFQRSFQRLSHQRFTSRFFSWLRTSSRVFPNLEEHDASQKTSVLQEGPQPPKYPTWGKSFSTASSVIYENPSRVQQGQRCPLHARLLHHKLQIFIKILTFSSSKPRILSFI